MYILFIGSEEKEGTSIETYETEKELQKVFNEYIDNEDNMEFCGEVPSGMYDLSRNEYCLIKGEIIIPKKKETVTRYEL